MSPFGSLTDFSDDTRSMPEEWDEEDNSIVSRINLLASVKRRCATYARDTPNKFASRLTFTGDNLNRVILSDATIPYSALADLFTLAEEVSLYNVDCYDDELSSVSRKGPFTVKSLELGPEYRSVAKWLFQQPDPSKLFGQLHHLELDGYSPRLDWTFVSTILDKLNDAMITHLDIYLAKDPIDDYTPLGLRDPIGPHNFRMLEVLFIHIEHEFYTSPKYRNIYVYAWYLLRKFLRWGCGLCVHLRILGKQISIYRERFGHKSDSDWDFDELSHWLRREFVEWPNDMMLETIWLDDGRPSELLV